MKIKHIRIVVSGLILAAFISGFFLKISIFEKITSLIASLQFFPLLLSACKNGIIGIVLIIITVATFIFGRVYCSSICPLGTIQDCIGTFSKKKKRWVNPSLFLRYIIPFVSIISFVFGIVLLIELTEPYSIASRLLNFITFDSYRQFSLLMIVVLFIFVFIALLSFFKGRRYCNFVCPTGAILSLFSYFPLFAIRIDSEKCVSCKKCERVCKSECIDITNKKIDTSRCVLCFNCIDECKFNAIYYRIIKKKKESIKEKKIELTHKVTRRDFIGFAALGLFTYSVTRFFHFGHKKSPITPPGSVSLKHFTENCTSCHLCVSQCPTKVLRPATLEYGIAGLMQPYLDYRYGCCDYDCNICSQICPASAIQPVSLSEKRKISIGVASLDKSICIPYVEGTACAACDEMCPTGATRMVFTKKGLFVPTINEDICIGCGACEKACPVTPRKAITVASREVHTQIKSSVLVKSKSNKDFNDFAF